MNPTEQSWFAVVPPGLEQVALEELRDLGIRGHAERGGVLFGGGYEALYAVHLHARVPVRVWARVGRARGVRSLDALAGAIRPLPWADLVWPRQPVEVQVAAHQARWGRKDAIARKVELAIRDALRVPRKEGRRPPHEPAEILVRIDADQLEVSIDASGDRLHRRGWRRDTSEAPLRENLAAAVLWLAEWAPGETLVDPMCGSGTFVIEAATIAAALPPGRARAFAFERWPVFDAALWAQVRGRARGVAVSTRVVGSDIDEAVLHAARANARRAEVERSVDFRHGDVAELALPPGPPGLIVTNPPYGERIRNSGAAWAALGRWARERAEGWRMAVVCPDPGLLRRAGLRLPVAGQFSNGGIPVAVCVGKIGNQNAEE